MASARWILPMAPEATSFVSLAPTEPKRIWKMTPSFVPFSRQTRIISSAFASVVSSGFSTRTCFPASEAAITISLWEPVGVSTQMTSTASLSRRSR